MKIVWSICRIFLLTLFLPVAGQSWQADIIEKVRPSVVKISKSVWESDPLSGIHQHNWSGSGVIVAIDRGRAYILTNRHVADEAWYTEETEEKRWCEVDNLEFDCMPEFVKEETVVAFTEGIESRAVLHWRSPCADLALLEVQYSGSRGRPAELEETFQVGEEVFALGHPLGLE